MDVNLVTNSFRDGFKCGRFKVVDHVIHGKLGVRWRKTECPSWRPR
jgi:hypothetical protein